MKRDILLTIIFFLFLNFLTVSQENSKKEEKQEKKYKIVNFKAKNVRYNNNTKNVFAEGEVEITSEDVKITCDFVLYNRETEIAKIWGNPLMRQPGTEISCEKLTVDFKNKKILAENNIKMTQEKKYIKKESSFKEELSEKITILCGKVEYFYDRKEAFAEGNIKVIQEDSTASAEKAYYYDKEEKIVVEGNVKLERKNGEWLTCQKAVISLKEDTVEAIGVIESQILVEEEKIPETKF